MTRLKLYAVIYVVLLAFSSAQAGVEFAGVLESNYWLAFWAIIVLSSIKTVLVAGYYQHLRWEPFSVTSLAITGLFAVLALTIAAGYSIT
jgi:cytochrome c oxidase subunit 4